MGTERIRVFVVFGGRSGEHEVSLMSARNIVAALDPERYQVVTIGINQAGQWLMLEDPASVFAAGQVPDSGTPLAALPGAIKELPGSGRAAAIFFPVLHGPYGEDGTVQGLFELAGVPYVGCGVLAAAVSMDKTVAKALFAQVGLPVVPGDTVLRSRWESDPAAITAQITSGLGFPCFVKPANLGSSLGISKVKDVAGLAAAIQLACQYDGKILVERAVAAREIEVAILGNEHPQASVPGEIVPGNEFYDYRDKYFDDNAKLLVPAPLTPFEASQVREMALVAYRAVDASGMARVDFFLDRNTGTFYINELNSIPGFTRISMYPKLWEASGLSYPALVDRLIELGLQRWRDRQRNRTSL